MKQNALNALKEACQRCCACPLAQTRQQVVFSGGNPLAQIMIVGEAPGQEEDKIGEPFVGRSGQLLMRLLADFGFQRDRDLYIVNTVKCRPPQNRKPSALESQACRSFLEAQFDIVKPKIVLLCGATALKSQFPQEKRRISELRGQWLYTPSGLRMMPVFHPSYLLRQHSLEAGSPRTLMTQDLLEVRRIYETYTTQ